MVAYTIAANAKFTSGDTIGVYLPEQVDRSGTPSGSPVTTATAGTGGTVTFASGLTAATTYHAMTQVSTVWRRITFTTAPLGAVPVGAPVAGPKGDKGDTGDAGATGPAGSVGPELTAEVANRQGADVAHVLALDPHGDRSYADDSVASTLTSIAQSSDAFVAYLASLAAPKVRATTLTADFGPLVSQISPQAVPSLGFDLEGGADEVWAWDILLRVQADATTVNMRIDITRPGSAAGNWGAVVGPNTTVGGWSAQPVGGTDPAAVATLANGLAFELRSGVNLVHVKALVLAAAATGPVALTLRQSTSDVNGLTLLKGSSAIATKTHV